MLIEFIAKYTMEPVHRVSFYRHISAEMGNMGRRGGLHNLSLSHTHTHTHTQIPIDSIPFRFSAMVPLNPPTTTTPLTSASLDISLYGQQRSHDPRHGVRSPRQRERDQPGPNAIQIQECIQRKGFHAPLQQKPYDGNSYVGSTITTEASHGACRLGEESTSAATSGLWNYRMATAMIYWVVLSDLSIFSLISCSFLCSCCSLLWLTFCFLF